MATWAQRIGKRARQVRRDKGLGFEDVARRARLGIGALSEIETGKREARLGSYERLARTIGIPLAELLGVDGDSGRAA